MNRRISSQRLAVVMMMMLTLAFTQHTPAVAQADAGDLPTKRVEALFAEWDKTDSPGCVLGIIRDNRVIYQRGYGMANLEHNIPLTPATVFDIGSTSKQFTAMSVLLLARQGKLSLDDDIRKHVPEMPRYESPVTIRHLIHHTSGVRDYLTLASLAGTRDADYYTDDEVLETLARQKELNFQPGTEFLYSNSGYFLLSVIVKRASGKSLREFAAEHIFKPLGMTNTHFHDDHTEVVPRRATGYTPKPAGGFTINTSKLDMVGDGNIYTTVEDLARWDANLYDDKLGGGGRLLYEFLTPGKLEGGKQLDYAFGVYVGDYKGLKTVHHSGSWAGYRAEMIRFPARRFSVICLANSSGINPSRLARQVADIYLADDFKLQTPHAAVSAATQNFITLSQKELAGRAGAYREATSGAIWKVTADERGELRVATPTITLPAAPVSRTEFRVVGAPVDVLLTFDDPAPQKPRRMRVRLGTNEPLLFESFQPITLTPAQLAEYAGDYHSDELRVSYRVVEEGGRLYLRHENRSKDHPKQPLESSTKDAFGANGIGINFVRDGQLKITHFTINAGRVKNIRFDRRQ